MQLQTGEILVLSAAKDVYAARCGCRAIITQTICGSIPFEHGAEVNAENFSII